jgi:hypothetical protein
MSAFIFQSKMNTENVSTDFLQASILMHEIIDELYSVLHDGYGNSIVSEKESIRIANLYLKEMRIRLNNIERKL